MKDVHIEFLRWTELEAMRKFDSVARVGSPRALKVLCFILLTGLAASTAALVFVPWTQTVSGTGIVISYSPADRPQNIEAPVDGRIDRWHVSEGMRVNVGDPLVDISDIDPDIMQRLAREQEAIRTRLEASQKSLDTSKINLERQKSLWEKGLSARRAYEVAELEYAKFLGDLSAAAAELARIETRIARQASMQITAQRPGILQRIIAPQGGVIVKQGDKLGVIVPESADRAVELFISGNDVPLVSKGREVRLQFEGWPAVQFAGWPSVAVGTFAGEIGFVDPSDDGTGKFRIIVFPKKDHEWPDPKYLRQGIRVYGWVLLDQVRVGWELWRRFNAFPVTATKEAETKTSTETGK